MVEQTKTAARGRKHLTMLAITCALAIGVSPSPSLSDSKPPSVRISAVASKSVVRLETLGTLYSGEKEITVGTGFVVSQDGLAVTCSHVVPKDILYEFVERKAYFHEDETPVRFTVDKRDEKSDLALVRLESRGVLEGLPVGNSDIVEMGEELYILGYPLNYPLYISPGLLSSKLKKEGRWLTGAPLNPGNSGGPAFTADGYVVGIAVGGVPKARIHLGGLKYIEKNVQGINHLLPINIARTGILSSLAIRQGALPSPTLVGLQAPLTIKMSYGVSEVNDEHPIFLADYTRSYERAFPAEPGYKIVGAELVKNSATRVSDELLSVSPDGTQVIFRFSLTSGPAIDRYRGWLDASIQTTQVEIKQVPRLAFTDTIASQNSGRIFDRANHIWIQDFKVDKSTRTLSFVAGATAKECIPTGNKGAWVSVTFIDGRGNELGTYENIAIANVHNARNVNRIEVDLSRVSNEDLQNAKTFVPMMKGSAGC